MDEERAALELEILTTKVGDIVAVEPVNGGKTIGLKITAIGNVYLTTERERWFYRIPSRDPDGVEHQPGDEKRTMANKNELSRIVHVKKGKPEDILTQGIARNQRYETEERDPAGKPEREMQTNEEPDLQGW